MASLVRLVIMMVMPITVVVIMVVVVSMVLLLTLVPVVAPGVEGEGVHERPCSSLFVADGRAGLPGKLGRGGTDREGNKANLKGKMEGKCESSAMMLG